MNLDLFYHFPAAVPFPVSIPYFPQPILHFIQPSNFWPPKSPLSTRISKQYFLVGFLIHDSLTRAKYPNHMASWWFYYPSYRWIFTIFVVIASYPLFSFTDGIPLFRESHNILQVENHKLTMLIRRCKKKKQSHFYELETYR